MALTFKPLKTGDDLFGISLGGSYGRGDKSHLLDLARRCLERKKVRVVVDASGLKNLGGGGAAAFAEFQALLTDAGGEAVFVGVGDVAMKYLAGKFGDLPLRNFPDLDAAVRGYDAAAEAEPGGPEDGANGHDESGSGGMDDVLASFSEMMPDPAPLEDCVGDAEDAAKTGSGEEAGDVDQDEVVDEVGAVGFFAEEFEIDAPGPEGDDPEYAEDEQAAGEPVPAEPAGAEASPADDAAGADRGDGNMSLPKGRRPEHSYTSLSDAINALGGWSGARQDEDFGRSLENLLFSHGLAESALFLARRDGSYGNAGGKWSLPEDGSLARQLFARLQPLTLLDIQDEDLDPRELALLEEIAPDILVPVRSEGEPAAILMLKRPGEGDEYSVVEHFALELLMRVLSGEETGGGSHRPAVGPVEEEEDQEPLIRPAWSGAASDDDTLSEVLLRLALELPDADDRPHFWRIFSRNVWPVLPVTHLAFLGPDKRKAPVMVGHNEALAAINLGVSHMKVFFQTMERPVAAANLPEFFKETRKAILEAGVDWIVSLRWEDQYLGTALIGLDESCDQDPRESAERIHDLFAETARMLARFDDSHGAADQNLELVALVMGQREKRLFGGDEMTRSLVSHMRKLARAMGFPPDQERDLIYGCLLRDIGLIDKDDDLMGPPEKLDPVQWSLYKRHPEEGARLLEPLGVSATVIEAVRHHHERFGGEGFPHRLKGREIPLGARVVTVVENYVSMVVGTESREPVAPEDAARIMHDNLGQRYDPEVVQIFLRAIMPESVPALTGDPA